jgi:hypothetical protein
MRAAHVEHWIAREEESCCAFDDRLEAAAEAWA